MTEKLQIVGKKIIDCLDDDISAEEALATLATVTYSIIGSLAKDEKSKLANNYLFIKLFTSVKDAGDKSNVE